MISLVSGYGIPVFGNVKWIKKAQWNEGAFIEAKPNTNSLVIRIQKDLIVFKNFKQFGLKVSIRNRVISKDQGFITATFDYLKTQTVHPDKDGQLVFGCLLRQVVRILIIGYYLDSQLPERFGWLIFPNLRSEPGSYDLSYFA